MQDSYQPQWIQAGSAWSFRLVVRHRLDAERVCLFQGIGRTREFAHDRTQQVRDARESLAVRLHFVENTLVRHAGQVSFQQESGRRDPERRCYSRQHLQREIRLSGFDIHDVRLP